MFSYNFVLFSLIVGGVSVQANNSNDLLSNGYPFGQLRQLVQNQNGQLLSSSGSFSNLPNLNQDQPVSSRCIRVRPNIKMPDPTDNTKYYQCRNEFQYETFTCPNGGIFVDERKACIDLCEQKKPCLNDGQCIILSNLTLECVCRRDWTGERCEIPLSSCANNPCGPNAECRMLKSTDYTQDYVCICNNQQSYGRNCQQTVPNPCLSSSRQFHPFAFSRRAYINCDGRTIFFQPCNSLLYWNQEEKRCDRTLPDILKSPFLFMRNQNPKILSQNSFNAGGSTVNSPIAIAPVRNQLQSNFPTSDAKPTQWQNQQQLQNNQQQFIPTLDLPTQISREQNQGLGIQHWQNLVSEFKTQNNQPVASQSKPWQGSQTIHDQPWFQSQNEQSSIDNSIETTTTVPQVIFHLQGFSNQNFGEQKPQWQNNANNQIQSSMNSQTQFAVQPQSLQGSQSINSQPWLQGQNQQVPNNNFVGLPSERPQEQGRGNQLFQSADFNTQNKQGFVTQPNQWSGTSSGLQQQFNGLTSQPSSQNQNQRPLQSEITSQMQQPIQQNTQFGFNQQQPTASVQQQSWQNIPNNQQLQTQNFAAQSLSRSDQVTSNLVETTTIGNAGLQQGLFIHTLREWQPNRQESFNQADQQKTLNSIPTL